jgi:hypothetical protein
VNFKITYLRIEGEKVFHREKEGSRDLETCIFSSKEASD